MSDHLISFYHEGHFHEDHVDVDFLVEVEFGFKMVVGFGFVVVFLVNLVQLI